MYTKRRKARVHIGSGPCLQMLSPEQGMLPHQTLSLPHTASFSCCLDIVLKSYYYYFLPAYYASSLEGI